MTPLPVLFATHKTAILGAGAAGVAGLALLSKKKKTTGTAAAGSPAGTIPAAAVIPSSGIQGAYPDTSGTDMYNQLEGQLERLQAGQGQAVPVPTPVASSLFAPTGTGNLVRYSNGTIAEVETDGSLYGLSPQEFFGSPTLSKLTPTAVSGAQPNIYSLATNLTAKNPTAKS